MHQKLRIGIKRYIRGPKDRRDRCRCPVCGADNQQVALVINPAVGCHYFLSGPRIPFHHESGTVHGRYQFMLLG